MRPAVLAFTLIGALAWFAPATAQEPLPKVAMRTDLGDIVVELDRTRAPVTVENFLRYVMDRHFDGTIIYRVVPGFVLQAGSYNPDLTQRTTRNPIPLEANNGLKNLRGALSMARSDPNSATAEFFINLVDNPRLDPEPGDTENKTGYAVFGRVVQGLEVIDQIAMVPLGDNGPFPGAAPVTPIKIQQVWLLPPDAPQPAPPAAP